MHIDFRKPKLQRAYEKNAAAVRLWGESVGRKYIQRLEVLYAARNFDEVRQIAALRVHELTNPRKGQWAIDLTGRWRLIVTLSENEQAITILEVTNHYGD